MKQLLNTRPIQLLIIALFVFSIFGTKAFVPHAYAAAYLDIRPNRDTCGKIQIAQPVASPSCNYHRDSYCPVPPAYPPSGGNSYSTSITVTSYDGRPHTFTYITGDSFCLQAYFCQTDTRGKCNDNNVYAQKTVSVPATVIMDASRLALNYGQACGSYQQDFYVTAVDGDTSCTYGTQGTASNGYKWQPGANSLCETGVTCSSTPPADVCSQPPSQLQGFFSSDGNFKIPGNGGTDLHLGIEGAIVVNAGKRGGTLQMHRTLGAGNNLYPAVTFRERPDMILNAPDLLKSPNYLYTEVAP